MLLHFSKLSYQILSPVHVIFFASIFHPANELLSSKYKHLEANKPLSKAKKNIKTNLNPQDCPQDSVVNNLNFDCSA